MDVMQTFHDFSLVANSMNKFYVNFDYIATSPFVDDERDMCDAIQINRSASLTTFPDILSMANRIFYQHSLLWFTKL